MANKSIQKMRLKYILFFGICLFVINGISAQSFVAHEASGISNLMDRYTSHNAQITHVKGYRIQIAATTDRAKIKSTAGKFSYKFPDMQADWINEAPYYKLRTGAFASKLECFYVLHQIQEDFPGAYMVMDAKIPIEEVRPK